MAVSKLEKDKDGVLCCPKCGRKLECLDGGQVCVESGRVDYDNVKPKYICRSCQSYYRELLNTSYYDVFDLTEKILDSLERQQAAEREKNANKDKAQLIKDLNPVVSLVADAFGKYVCPKCGKPMLFCEGGAVRIINGKVDYENVKPRYVCEDCSIFYRELLRSGLYEVFDLTEEHKTEVKQLKKKPKRKIKSIGDLKPVQLKRDVEGACACPRCGANMKFLPPDTVKIVDGRADMSDIFARFRCDECDSLYRQIAGTSYFQWCEK